MGNLDWQRRYENRKGTIWEEEVQWEGEMEKRE
jgi:hypothetical protein